MQQIRTFLWFNNQAEEAANYYVSIFKDAKIDRVIRIPGGPGGETVIVEFTLFDKQYIALDGGPGNPFTDAVSLFVSCKNQKEVDNYWSKLTSDGGSEGPCGWLKDKYGLSWQIVPEKMLEMYADKDKKKAERAMGAMMKMKKIELDKIEAAFNSK